MVKLLQIPSVATCEQKKHIKEIDQLVEELNLLNLPPVPDPRVKTAFQRMRDLFEQGGSLSVEEICKINQLVGGSGKLRGLIEGFWSEDNIAIRGYEGASAAHLEELLGDYVIEYNPTSSFSERLLKICGAYLVFALLHPFGDGNGRTGRIIVAWLMYAQGYGSLAPHLEKAMGNDNQLHGKRFESEVNNYLVAPEV